MRNVEYDLEDQHNEDPSIDVSKEAIEKAANEIFNEHYLGPIGGVRWVRLRGEFWVTGKCLGEILMLFDSYEQTRGTV